jgi:hypothetical protein
MRLLLRTLVVLLALSLFSCGERAVSRNELVGTWKIDVDSRERLPRQLQLDTSALILKGDGTFEARELPGQLWGHENCLITGSGHWAIGKRDHRALTLALVRVTACDNLPVPSGTDLFAAATRQGVKLRYFIGDPDDWKTIEFVKRQADR